MISKTLSLEGLCAQEDIVIDSSIAAANNVVIVPKRIKGKDHINSDFIPLIKRIRLETKTSHIAKRDGEPSYYDFRGGEYEFPLFILKEVVLHLVLGVIAIEIDKMLSNYWKSKKEDPDNPRIQEPSIKARWYITESQEYFELEGPATEASETISRYLKERKRKS